MSACWMVEALILCPVAAALASRVYRSCRVGSLKCGVSAPEVNLKRPRSLNPHPLVVVCAAQTRVRNVPDRADRSDLNHGFHFGTVQNVHYEQVRR